MPDAGEDTMCVPCRRRRGQLAKSCSSRAGNSAIRLASCAPQPLLDGGGRHMPLERSPSVRRIEPMLRNPNRL